jgi:methylmalonyl-CoA/ethylmalonyl-CoA epimerase
MSDAITDGLISLVRRAWITRVRQACIVVEDCDAAIREMHATAGIGPWSVWVPRLTDTKVRGIPTNYRMRLALAWTGDFMWEVIQPLDGHSIYREFLDARGEGVHHLLVETAGHEYDDLLVEATRLGHPPLMEGCWEGRDFAYLDTTASLRIVLEIARPQGDPGDHRLPAPEYIYPEAADRA